MSQTKQKKNSPDPKKQKKFGKSFFVNLVTVIQERVGAIIGICLIVVSIFVAFSMILYFMNETAFKRAFTSPYYTLVKLAVIVILIYTMISTADFIINFISPPSLVYLQALDNKLDTILSILSLSK